MIALNSVTHCYVTNIKRRWSVKITDHAPRHLPQHDPIERTTWREGRECDQLSLLIHDLDYISCQIRFFKNGHYHLSSGIDPVVFLVDDPNATIDLQPLYGYEAYTPNRRGTFYAYPFAPWSIATFALDRLPAPGKQRAVSTRPWTVVIDDKDEDGEGRERYAIVPMSIPYNQDQHLTAWSITHRQADTSLCTVLQNTHGAFALVTEGSLYAIADPRTRTLTILPWCDYTRGPDGLLTIILDPELESDLPYDYLVEPDDLKCAKILTAVRRDLKKHQLSITDADIVTALHLPTLDPLSAEPRAYYFLKALDEVTTADLHRLLSQSSATTRQDEVILSILRLMPAATRQHLAEHVHAAYDKAQRVEQASQLATSYPVWAAEVVRNWHEMASLSAPLMADDVLTSVATVLDVLQLSHAASWSLLFNLHEAGPDILMACLPQDLLSDLQGQSLSPLMGLYHACHPLISQPNSLQAADAIKALWILLAQPNRQPRPYVTRSRST